MIVPCYRGGHHCKWPACSLDCDGRVGKVGDPDVSKRKIILTNERPLPAPSKDGLVRWTTDKFEATHMVLNGVYYVKGPSGNWFAPDYTQPGTAEAVKADVDATVEDHWSIDRWRK